MGYSVHSRMRPGPKRILVVYDEPTMRAIVAKALGRANNLVETGDPRIAFALLAASGRYPASLGKLATAAAMSRSHFSHTFHAVAGVALRDYVRDLRLQHAHRLILSSQLSLTDVAIESGFYDLPHFDKAFRQRIGVSPREYRIRYRLDHGGMSSGHQMTQRRGAEPVRRWPRH